MADSMRDQLLKAGFSTPTPEPTTRSDKKKVRKPSRGRGTGTKSQAGRPPAQQTQARKASHGSGNTSAADAETTRRKVLKAQIKALIEKELVEKYSGESVYRYVLGTRIRELHVTPEIHRQLVDGVLSVTRLNGNTCIVPAATVEAIRQINPDWAIMKPASDASSNIEGYEQFQVPDDLQW